jgi:hypothetical protein
VGPNTRSGLIEIETNSRPIRAELTVALVTKKLSNAAGTMRRKFEASTLVVLVEG